MRLKIGTLEPVAEIDTDIVPDVSTAIPDILSFSIGGHKYILDPNKLKTQEDIINIIKHFSTRVELNVSETIGIEQYVKPVLPFAAN